jgi:alkylated DNA nucleotide flippase Atl1
MDLASPRARRVLERVRAIPPGFVRAYSDLEPLAPRFAGAVLAACDDPAIPWHRVVRADGSLAKGAHQRELLRAEDVPFRRGRVVMAEARLPAELPVAQPRTGTGCRGVR